MPLIIEKPKSWFAEVCDMRTGVILFFPANHQDSIKSMISGRVKRKYPKRKYTVKKVFSFETLQDHVTVTRLNDTLI